MYCRVNLLAVLVCTACAGISRATSPTPPNLPGNWKLTFDDEFSAPLNSTTWKTTIWNTKDITFGGSEVYRSSGVTVNNGILSLTASKQTVDGFPYVSGLVDTGPVSPNKPTGYSFLYGYAEASIKLVSGHGLWPAFWMLPDPNPAGAYHDADGEIDIMEELGHQPTLDEIHYHQGDNQWGGYYDAGVDLSAAFHTYAVNWKPGETDYYLDGKMVESIAQAPSVAEYLILDMGVGDSATWPGPPDANTVFPSSMQVDYVHVFQTVPEPTSALVAMGLLIPMMRRRSRKKFSARIEPATTRPIPWARVN